MIKSKARLICGILVGSISLINSCSFSGDKNTPNPSPPSVGLDNISSNEQADTTIGSPQNWVDFSCRFGTNVERSLADGEVLYAEDNPTELPKNLDGIKAVYLGNSKVTNISSLAHSEVKFLSQAFSDFKDWSQIAKIASLERLELGGFHMSLQDFFETQDVYKNIERLYIRNTSFDDFTFALGRFPNLKQVSFTMVDINQVGFDNLAMWMKNLPKLEELNIHISPFASSQRVRIDAIAELGELKKFTIRISRTEKDFSWISSLTSLEALCLSLQEQKQIDYLGPLKELKYLSIDRNYISDLSPLRNHSKLEYINLGQETWVDDDGYNPIINPENRNEDNCPIDAKSTILADFCIR